MSTVSDKVAAGDYRNKLTYPESPSKPRLPHNPTAAQAREYADKLEAYEDSKGELRRQRDLYNAETRQLEAQFREDLEAEYNMKGHPKADVLFMMAWDRGHSSGYGEVASYYDDFHELITPVK
jgi:hypothetical protein